MSYNFATFEMLLISDKYFSSLVGKHQRCCLSSLRRVFTNSNTINVSKIRVVVAICQRDLSLYSTTKQQKK